MFIILIVRGLLIYLKSSADTGKNMKNIKPLCCLFSPGTMYLVKSNSEMCCLFFADERSRVKLDAEMNRIGSDYINASYIVSYNVDASLLHTFSEVSL